MDDAQQLKERLDRLRPLSSEQLSLLFPRWQAEDALFVYGTNAIEGSSLTLGETILVLEDGVTIGGKPLRDHIDAVNGQRAYALMLDLARARTSIDLSTILEIHKAVVGDAGFGGRLRDQPVYMRGSMHVPPNHVKVPQLLEEMLERYVGEMERDHPVAVASRLHFDLVTIHPFVDGNGRTARLLQNLHLIREGFVPVLLGPEEKAHYFAVLERAQVAVPGVGDATEFVAYMAELEGLGLERYLAGLEIAHGSDYRSNGPAG